MFWGSFSHIEGGGGGKGFHSLKGGGGKRFYPVSRGGGTKRFGPAIFPCCSPSPPPLPVINDESPTTTENAYAVMNLFLSNFQHIFKDCTDMPF